MSTIKVSTSYDNENYLTHMDWSTHTYIADEPEDAGGKNLGPTPIEYMLMSLASCTVITLRMYANRKEYKLDDISLDISTEKPSGKNKRKIHMDILIKGKLEKEQQERMEEISHRCPVHKLLQDSTEITTTLKVQ